MTFVENCYKVTQQFPREEMYGLTSQLRRAAVSIPSNVAEGYCRRSTEVYANHVSSALGHTPNSKHAPNSLFDWGS
jgi:four helix bundle protein